MSVPRSSSVPLAQRKTADDNSLEISQACPQENAAEQQESRSPASQFWHTRASDAISELLKEISAKRANLLELKRQQAGSDQGCNHNTLVEAKADLARHYHKVAERVRRTQLQHNYPAAEQHFLEALRLWRSLRDLKAMGDPLDQIFPRLGLARLYEHWGRRAEAVDVLSEALATVRSWSTSAWMTSSERMQAWLSRLLMLTGRMFVQHAMHSRSTARVAPPRAAGSSLPAPVLRQLVQTGLAMFNEALMIHQTLVDHFDFKPSQSEQRSGKTDKCIQPNSLSCRQIETARILHNMSDACFLLALYDEAMKHCKEAQRIRRHVFGQDSGPMIVGCLRLCQVLRELASSLLNVTSNGIARRVRVCGLGSTGVSLLKDGLTGTILGRTLDAKKISVRLDRYPHRQVAVKPENMCWLLTEAQLTAQRTKIRALRDEHVSLAERLLRAAVKVHGEDCMHSHGALSLWNAGEAYIASGEPDKTRAAVAMLRKALVVHRTLCAEDSGVHVPDPVTARMSSSLLAAIHAESRFKNLSSTRLDGGVLSAKPGVWPPTSRQEDELSLRDLFEAVCTFKGGGAWQFIDAATMQDTLRRFGCERFVVLSEEPVDAARFIAQGCHELTRMKNDALWACQRVVDLDHLIKRPELVSLPHVVQVLCEETKVKQDARVSGCQCDTELPRVGWGRGWARDII